MGLMSQTQIHYVTDLLAGRILAMVHTPLANALAANTEEGLATYLDDASSDPDLQAALLDALSTVDRQALSSGMATYFDRMLTNREWRDVVRDISTYVKSTDGGSYANLAAYLTGVTGTLHPVIAELCIAALGRAAMETSGAPIGMIHPKMMARAFDKVYVGPMGTLVDDTTDAGDTDVGDVTCFAANDDIIALGSRYKFNHLLLELGTLATADVTLEGFYWNGSSWSELTLTDQTTGFSVNGGHITWTMPTDWVPTRLDMDSPQAVFADAEEGEYYYVILQGQTQATDPLLTWILMVPEALMAPDNALELYGMSDQPPLAIVRITDTNVCTVTEIQDPDGNRFVYPGTGNSELELRAITILTEDVTFTLGYKDQAGAASTKAQTAWTGAVAAGGTKTLALDGDTGLSELTGSTCAITTANTSGVFVIEVADYSRAIQAI